MSGFGFDKSKAPAAASTKALDVSGLPSDPIVPSVSEERDAIARGEKLGFVDRGQGRGAARRRPPPPPTQNLFIKGPADIVDWLVSYTSEQGHSAYWKSIADFKAMVEGGATPARKR
jgi:hypothetical protein